MIDRTDRVKLPAAWQRCSSDTCKQGSTCARRLATIPIGTPLCDYTGPNFNGGEADCGYFVSISQGAALEAAQRNQATKRAPKQFGQGEG
jgi:hypothetical protein